MWHSRVLHSARLGINTPKNLSSSARISRRGRQVYIVICELTLTLSLVYHLLLVNYSKFHFIFTVFQLLRAMVIWSRGKRGDHQKRVRKMRDQKMQDREMQD